MVKALGQTLALEVPWDVFSSQRIDEGTLLLLQNLPPGEPRSVLDLGCGYGALGLPVAARWPGARCLLIDRDLLAVHAASLNARALGLDNVEVRAGLGYRGVRERFDWILCNVPARIGPRAIRHFYEGGRALGEEVRTVVIRDLAPAVEALRLDGLSLVARGPRHQVFARGPGPRPAVDLADESIYQRDETELEGLRLSRPQDASEDPGHPRALAILASALPRSPPARALTFRSGYGALPLLLKKRFPAAQVIAQERDLLDAAFLRRNSAALGLPVEARETLFPAEGLPERSFALVAGELSAAAGPAVAARELQEAAGLLASGGEALILASEKQEREWFPKVAPHGASLTILLRREGASVLRLSASGRGT